MRIETWKTVGLVALLVFFGAGIWANLLGQRELRDYRERARRVELDLGAARDAQHEAEKRVDHLQGELAGARERARCLQDRLGRVTELLGQVSGGIDSARGTVTDSGELIRAGREIIQRIHARGPIPD